MSRLSIADIEARIALGEPIPPERILELTEVVKGSLKALKNAYWDLQDEKLAEKAAEKMRESIDELEMFA